MLLLLPIEWSNSHEAFAEDQRGSKVDNGPRNTRRALSTDLLIGLVRIQQFLNYCLLLLTFRNYCNTVTYNLQVDTYQITGQSEQKGNFKIAVFLNSHICSIPLVIW